MSTFNVRFAAAIKSYKNSGASLKLLVIEAIDYASESGTHNPVYLNKVLAAMEGKDVDAMAVIIKTFAPFNVKDGVAKVQHKNTAREYTVDRIMVDTCKSFRTLAMELTGEKVKAVWELEKAALAYAAACRKANVQDSACHAAVTRAHVHLDQVTCEKEIAAEVKRVAKIVKMRKAA